MNTQHVDIHFIPKPSWISGWGWNSSDVLVSSEFFGVKEALCGCLIGGLQFKNITTSVKEVTCEDCISTPEFSIQLLGETDL